MGKNKECANCSLAEIGYCPFPEEIRNQAAGKQWGPDTWRSYVDRMQRDILPECQEQPELKDALKTQKPVFATSKVGELKP